MFDFNNSNKADIMIKKIPTDRITPVQVLEQLNAVALLESAYYETGRGKYSIMILKEAFTIYKEKERYILKGADNKKFNITTSLKSYLPIIDEFRKRAPEPPPGLDDLRLPLGGLGYLGYEYFEEIEDLKFENEDDRGLYDSAFIFGRLFLIFDHLHDEAVIAAVNYENEANPIELSTAIEEVESRINRAINDGYNGQEEEKIAARIVSPNDKEKFMEKVDFIKDEIYKGNLLQCVISRRIEIETESPVSINAYRNLRMKNPSPYMFYLKFGSFTLFGASPEVMVKVDSGRVIVRPIAGTRPRGRNMAEDFELENELLNDIKERAEHLMLIDLGRNDVGKVSTGGSVRVTEEMVIEKYSAVMHIVSEVEGKLDKKFNAIDAINATVPAGTVSGAPKIQAIKTIEKLEEYRRGPYAGVIGYFEKDGSLDSAIAIRTAVCKDNKIWLQAGAGIVHDSVPEKEYEETQNKMLALLRALNINIDKE